MSNKATLLSTIKPEAKSNPVEATTSSKLLPKPILEVSSTPLLKPIDSSGNSGQLLAPIVTRTAHSDLPDSELNTGDASFAASESAVASQAVAADASGTTPLQAAVYFSSALSFCMAGFAALILLRKSAKMVEQRFIKASQILGLAFGVAALHGIFATFLYTSYLSDPSRGVPLALSIAVWIILGPSAGIAVNHLMASKELPRTKDLAVDAAAYFGIFICATISMSNSIGANAAWTFGLIPLCLLTVPVAHQVKIFKRARADSLQSVEILDKMLFGTLMILPCVMPIPVVLKLIGLLSPELTLFLFNFLLLNFLLLVGSSILLLKVKMPVAGVARTATNKLTPLAQAEINEVIPAEPAALEEIEAADQSSTIAFSNAPLNDPIIEFLKTQDAESEQTASKPLPRKPLSSRKLTRPAVNIDGPLPPQKPGPGKASESAPNAPERFKAPAKPKKRF